jgi:prephenate dehydrogenase
MLGKNLTIIGGSGGMGRVFGEYFKEKGFRVTLFARNKEKLKLISEQLNVNYDLDLHNAIEHADIIIISVPIPITPEIIRMVTPLMKPNALIFDICSLKNQTFKALNEMYHKYPINCLSLHPMFGPGVQNLKNYIILGLRVGGTESYNDLVDELFTMFKSDGIIIQETTPEVHDFRIALTLGVPHMINIIFLNLLKQTNIPLSELTKYTGTTFLLQKVFAESIIQREMEMFGDIQIENREFYKVTL